MDLTATAVSPRLEPDENTDLVFSCQSIQQAATHAAYRRIVTMSNLNTCPLLFRMHTEGPFELVAVTPSAPQDPVAYQGIVGAPASFGDQTYLPPRESVDVSLHFWPNRAAASASGSGVTNSAPPGASGGRPTGLTSSTSIIKRRAGGVVADASWEPQRSDDFSLDGCLVISYSNGDVQRLPLKVQLYDWVMFTRATYIFRLLWTLGSSEYI